MKCIIYELVINEVKNTSCIQGVWTFIMPFITFHLMSTPHFFFQSGINIFLKNLLSIQRLHFEELGIFFKQIQIFLVFDAYVCHPQKIIPLKIVLHYIILTHAHTHKGFLALKYKTVEDITLTKLEPGSKQARRSALPSVPRSDSLVLL